VCISRADRSPSRFSLMRPCGRLRGVPRKGDGGACPRRKRPLTLPSKRDLPRGGIGIENHTRKRDRAFSETRRHGGEFSTTKRQRIVEGHADGGGRIARVALRCPRRETVKNCAAPIGGNWAVFQVTPGAPAEVPETVGPEADHGGRFRRWLSRHLVACEGAVVGECKLDRHAAVQKRALVVGGRGSQRVGAVVIRRDDDGVGGSGCRPSSRCPRCR